MIHFPVPEALTFDDVLLLPARSDVIPAQAVTQTQLTRNISLNIPIVSAAMDTVTESHMAIALAQQGGLGIIHRNLTIEQQANEVDKVKRSESGMIVDPVTMSPTDRVSDALEVMRKYKISGVPITEHGKLVGILTNRDLRFETRFDIPIDKVMTKKNLITVPVGTTRVVTGAGVPQITAIAEAYRATKDAGVPIIADGGIKYSGDVTKALAAGASAVMIGSLFAGTDESPGEMILYQGRSFKSYRGMGSIGAMAQGSSERYFQSTEGDSSASISSGDGDSNRLAKLVPEGIEGRVPYRGSVAMIVHQMVGGLKSGMGYCGCSTIPELLQKTRFVRISGAGLRESHVHDVMITREAPNYAIE
jgi:IMP dehydrogenase